MRIIITAAFVLALGACGSADADGSESVTASSPASTFIDADDTDDTDATSADEAVEERAPFDEDAAKEEAEEEVRDEGYSGSCTVDCSGHDAGFAWAGNGNPDGGTSSSQSFDEGQRAYEDAVEERVEEARSEYEAGEDEQ